MPRNPNTGSGKELNMRWNVGARHSLYRQDGKFYMPLERFPGAFFDPNGYIKFCTKKEYQECSYLNIGERVNIPDGIKSIPGYVKMQ